MGNIYSKSKESENSGKPLSDSAKKSFSSNTQKEDIKNSELYKALKQSYY